MTAHNKYFIDSNILLYSISDEPYKKDIAKRLVRNTDVVISSQVLNEFCNVVFKKRLLNHEQLFSSIVGFSQVFSVIEISSDLVIHALTIKNRHRYSYWDSLIIAAALHSGVNFLYSEDMHHGQVIDGKLTIINPFIDDKQA